MTLSLACVAVSHCLSIHHFSVCNCTHGTLLEYTVTALLLNYIYHSTLKCNQNCNSHNTPNFNSHNTPNCTHHQRHRR